MQKSASLSPRRSVYYTYQQFQAFREQSFFDMIGGCSPCRELFLEPNSGNPLRDVFKYGQVLNQVAAWGDRNYGCKDLLDQSDVRVVFLGNINTVCNLHDCRRECTCKRLSASCALQGTKGRDLLTDVII